MGQTMSCGKVHENDLFVAVRNGDLETIEAMVETHDPTIFATARGHSRQSALHMAAMLGRIEVLSFLLDRVSFFSNPDVLNRYKQTPLMLAAIHGKISCVKKLIESGAFILKFDSQFGRTCLHYAAFYGRSDCLEAILAAARTSRIADSWGFSRFVNTRDEGGETSLHLAAQYGRPECVQILLHNGALVSAVNGFNGHQGNTPLHHAAEGGSVECVRELLAWGADRLQPDLFGRIPYLLALQNKHQACAALLNPSSAEPLVWPLLLRLMTDLNPETKSLLEKALKEINMEREKSTSNMTTHSGSFPSPAPSVDDSTSEASNVEECSICFERLCAIELKPCSHQMCAHCTLALCCYKKPDPSKPSYEAPICPFCRCSIANLLALEITNNTAVELESSPSKQRKPRKSSEGSSSGSFKGLSAMGSFVKKGGRISGKVAAACTEASSNKHLQIAGMSSHPCNPS
ncbi:hypothetical protein Dsin_006257 [Dipteronia sinensis]|uniref:RING-type E3 ubiquitin transferase n=1 Tax=Dipteronia sinensis TaxID=43782 RepID=A0AAE0AZ94_9ROSI|nr:hypothetical protein Dsin_006257 [Dipteronia sinensis]